MRGLSTEKMLVLAKKDVEIVREEAKFFIEITENGDAGEIKSNPYGNINSLAVIGPVGIILLKDISKKILEQEKFLLFEIGLQRGKPYRTGYDREKKNGVFYVPPRHKYFLPSDVQYCRVAPAVFEWLQCETLNRIKGWKRDPFITRTAFQKQERSADELLSASNGICFSVSLEDTYFVRDILWASAENEVRKRFLKWLCALSVKKLSYKRKRTKARESLKKLLSHRPHYVIEDMLEFLPKEKMFLFNDIVDLAGWDLRETEERRLKNLALPNPQSRIGDIELRINRIDKHKGFLVFEVFPQVPQKPRIPVPF